MLGTQIAARLYPRVGPRALIGSGQALVTGMLICLALLLQPSTPWLVAVLLMFVLGIGQAHTFMPSQAAAFDTVPRARTGEATSLYNATRQAGSAIGVALAATVIASRRRHRLYHGRRHRPLPVGTAGYRLLHARQARWSPG